MKRMRVIRLFRMLALASIVTANMATAATYDITGTVARLLTIHSDVATNPNSGSKVYLSTTTSAGTCPKDGSGRVIFWIRIDDPASDRMYDSLLAAYLSGTPVTLRADDTKTTDNTCLLQFVQFGS